MFPIDFVDPQQIDWTSGFNPQRVPGWRYNNNIFVRHCLEDPFNQALDHAEGPEPAAYVCPEPLAQLIPGSGVLDYEVPIEPNTWLFAIGALPAIGTDFLFNVTDSETSAPLFSAPVMASTMQTQTAGRGPQVFLPTPHLFASPGFPIVRLINLSGGTARCIVVLYCVTEYVPPQ